jgi:CMP-N,N'-diacetyllegionaminic acid synthase
VIDPHVLGLLPARGGSKGIPGKNLRLLCGRPLLAWAATALARAPSIARAVCSTDDYAIAEAAKASGLEVPFFRPAGLASDTAMVVDVALHALEALDDPARPFTHIALVQATSPSVKVKDIEAAIDLIRAGEADTVISGFRAGMHHPAIMYNLDENGMVSWLLGDQRHHLQRRQEFPIVFVRTGLVYIISTKVLRESKTLYGDQIRTLVVEEDRAVTIDEERDFLRAQQIMEGNIND